MNERSGAESYCWAALIATSAVLYHFHDRMTEGLRVVEHPAGDLLGIFLRVILMTICLHVVIAVVFSIKRGAAAEQDGNPYEQDERDLAIERKGERFGYAFLGVAINLIVLMLLFEYAYPGHSQFAVSVLGPAHMFFALLASLLFSDIVKRVTMLMAYRA
ncbi:MAG: hypothetical protein JKY61_04565 [Planctomycetes bacterium]|nr:hypothetical protein [Planctomycetota bacterium]